MYAGESRWGVDGIVGRIMRRVLQLRTPESVNGDEHHFSSMSAAAKLGSSNGEAKLDIAAPRGEANSGTPAPKIRFREPQIEMAHGAGGKASRRLVEGLFAPFFFGASPEPLGDAARLSINGARMAVTTDSFVVKPLVFPGGSIGELAINGTVNDLAVAGAKPEAILVPFMLEAGLATEILEAEVRAMGKAAHQADVVIAGGDTKVVEHGKADHMYITTTGIGRLIPGRSEEH